MFNNRFTKKDSVVDAVSQVLESWDDDEDDDVKRADAELKRMKVKPIEADKKTDPDKEIGKLAKKTPKEVDEEVVAEDKWTDIADGPWKKSNRSKSSSASAAANAAGKGLKGAQHKLDVAEPKGKLTGADFKKLRKEDAEQIDEISKKLAVGYMRANTKRMASLSNPDSMEKKMKRHDAYDTATKKYHGEKGVKVKATEEVEHLDELSRDLVQRYIRKTKPEYSSPSEIKKREGGRSLALKKAYGDKKYGLPEPKVKATEEVELDEKTLTPAESKKKEEIVKSMKKGAKGFKERYGKRAKEVMYATATKQAKKVAEETVSEAKGPTSTYGLETNTVESSCTPLSRVKDLARSSMSKIKNEMLGKAGATSEEIDPSVRSTDTLKGRVAGGKTDDVGPKADGKSTKVKFTPGPK